MGFEDVLRRRLGGFWSGPERRRDTHHPARPAIERAWVRRALGVELRVRVDRSWAEVEAAGPRGVWTRLTRAEAAVVASLAAWQPVGALGLSPARVDALVDADLLYLAEQDPQRALAAPSAGPGVRLALRRDAWPTVAAENAVEIAPLPFMPRGVELEGVSLAGVRFGVHERGVDVFGVTITGAEALGRALAALVARLDGRFDAAALLEATPEAERRDVERLVALLDALALLERRADVVPRVGVGARVPRERVDVTWLGHAAVLVEADGRRVLVDPLVFADSATPDRWASAPKIDPRGLGPLDAVLVTHGDNDHLNASTLLFVDRGTTIVVPRGDPPPPPVHLDMRGLLRLLGFTRVVELEVGDTLDVGALRVTACPFEGEDWGLPLAKLTYTVDAPGGALLFGADARLDAGGALERTMLARPRPIDLAFLGVSGSAEAYATPREYGYGNFYAEWIPPALRNVWLQHCATPADAARFARAVGARRAFGYAAGGASWVATTLSDLGDHEALAAALADPERVASLMLGAPHTVEPTR
jgi:L-ascorbate metabolism protein UlaG (beta-lactamase superfamily)